MDDRHEVSATALELAIRWHGDVKPERTDDAEAFNRRLLKTAGAFRAFILNGT